MSSNLPDAIKDVLSSEKDVRIASAPYQQEFPYERDDESQVTRREFCNFLFVTSSALLASSAVFAGKSAYDATQVEQFTPMHIDGSATLEPGSALNFKYPGEQDSAILVRSPQGEYSAFNQKCTHLTCPVYYARSHDRLECPCHEGGFDARSGRVLYGPPQRPLDRIAIEVRGDEVWATGLIRGGEGGEHGNV